MKVRKFLTVFAIVTSFFASRVSFADEVYSYTVKGVVRGLPGGGRAKNELLVKHEPIPDYRDESGKVVGMEAMTMPFYLAPGVSFEGVQVGDKVEMSLESTVKPRFTEQVTALKKVP